MAEPSSDAILRIISASRTWKYNRSKAYWGEFVLPTVPGIPGPYRLFFYSFDCNERKHVHVRRDRAICKFWLEPVMLEYSNHFAAQELNRIHRLIVNNLDRIREAWDEHCGQ